MLPQLQEDCYKSTCKSSPVIEGVDDAGEEWMIGGGEEGSSVSVSLVLQLTPSFGMYVDFVSHVRMACKLGSWWQLVNTTHMSSFGHHPQLTQNHITTSTPITALCRPKHGGKDISTQIHYAVALLCFLH